VGAPPSPHLSQRERNLSKTRIPGRGFY